jgi:hypothetical protein
MKWSSLKKRVEDTFAPAVRGRVHIYSTAYQCSCGRGWFAVDGKEIADLNTLLAGSIYGAVYHETTKTECLKHPAVSSEDRLEGNLVERGEFSRFDLHEACWEYLHDLDPDQALSSENPLIVALAVLSSKVGKRRLRALAAHPEQLHPLARALLEFRMQAEGVTRQNTSLDLHNSSLHR